MNKPSLITATVLAAWLLGAAKSEAQGTFLSANSFSFVPPVTYSAPVVVYRQPPPVFIGASPVVYSYSAPQGAIVNYRPIVTSITNPPIPITSQMTPVTSYSHPVTSYSQPVTSYSLPVTSYSQPVTSYSQPVTVRRPIYSTTRDNLPPATPQITTPAGPARQTAPLATGVTNQMRRLLTDIDFNVRKLREEVESLKRPPGESSAEN